MQVCAQGTHFTHVSSSSLQTFPPWALFVRYIKKNLFVHTFLLAFSLSLSLAFCFNNNKHGCQVNELIKSVKNNSEIMLTVLATTSAKLRKS